VPDEPGDADLVAGLASPADAGWAALADAVRAVENEADHGRWQDSELRDPIVVDGVERPVYSMPYVEYSDRALHLLATATGVGAVQPFDWMAWDGLARFPQGRGLDDAPVAESIKAVTAIVRGDRFSEGTVLASLEEGTLLVAIRRLLRWNEHRHPPS
jgi:hypothetical protein